MDSSKCALLIFAIVVIYMYMNNIQPQQLLNGMSTDTDKSSFNDLLISNNIKPDIPQVFPPYDSPVKDFIPLAQPTVKEEVGLGIIYPQGAGASMSKLDSNAFVPGSPGVLLSDYTIPEAYGESSLTDQFGDRGANQGARVIKIKDVGNQNSYKALDESECCTFAAAYSEGEVSINKAFVNQNGPIDYSDAFIPEENLGIQTSPGQESKLQNCEATYPNVIKYDNFCITNGDIPYGKVVNGKVNPRLVSRWESYTGQYDPQDALDIIDGTLYPRLNVMQ
jgi:hypothetical protein